LTIGLKLIQATTDKVKVIQERMKAAQSRQKSYADRRRRPLEFRVSDHVFLRISLTKGIARFGKAGRLSLRYIGPYPITQRVGEVAYQLELPTERQRVHNVFHVSQLRKYISEPSHVIEPDPIQLQEDLSYEEQPVQILDRREKHLRRKIVPLVKVIWANHETSEATWEPEQEMRDKYPHLFS